jgi:hypothetical protein
MDNILRIDQISAKRFRGSRPTNLLAAATVALALAAGASQAFAGAGGPRPDSLPQAEQQRRTAPVLPPQAEPYGYSLEDMTRLTAAFNISDHSGPPPNSPFQILYVNWVTGSTDFTVPPGKFLYLPVMYNDNGPPIIGHFPANAEDRQQVSRYWFSQRELGVTLTQVVVDGKPFSLGAGYVTGASFRSPLADGATQYISPAAFLSPLAPGAHTVEIRFRAAGDALREPPINQYFPDGFWEFSTVYNVTVR